MKFLDLANTDKDLDSGLTVILEDDQTIVHMTFDSDPSEENADRIYARRREIYAPHLDLVAVAEEAQAYLDSVCDEARYLDLTNAQRAHVLIEMYQCGATGTEFVKLIDWDIAGQWFEHQAYALDWLLTSHDDGDPTSFFSMLEALAEVGVETEEE